MFLSENYENPKVIPGCLNSTVRFGSGYISSDILFPLSVVGWIVLKIIPIIQSICHLLIFIIVYSRNHFMKLRIVLIILLFIKCTSVLVA